MAQTFASSNDSRLGAASCAPASLCATSSPRGSSNSTATTAEASTTLAAVTGSPDDRDGFFVVLQAQAPHFGQHLGGRRGLNLLRGRLDDGEEFPLQRAV